MSCRRCCTKERVQDSRTATHFRLLWAPSIGRPRQSRRAAHMRTFGVRVSGGACRARESSVVRY